MNKKIMAVRSLPIFINLHICYGISYLILLCRLSLSFLFALIWTFYLYLDSFTCSFAFKSLEEKIRTFLYSLPLLSMFIFCSNILTKSPRFKFLNLLSYIHRLGNYQVIYLDLNPQSKK